MNRTKRTKRKQERLIARRVRDTRNAVETAIDLSKLNQRVTWGRAIANVPGGILPWENIVAEPDKQHEDEA